MRQQQSLKQIEGVARNVRWDRIPQGNDILSFRIEKTDDDGNFIDYTPVYLKVFEIAGVLVDGDQVKVTGSIDQSGTLKPTKISVTKGDTETHLGLISVDPGVFSAHVTFASLLLIIFAFVLFVHFSVKQRKQGINQQKQSDEQLYREYQMCVQNAPSYDAQDKCWDDYWYKKYGVPLVD